MFGKIVYVISVLSIVNSCFATEKAEKMEGIRDSFGRVWGGSFQIIDPITEYQNLSPRSKFAVACGLLDEANELDKIIGARLLIEAALTDKNSEALEMLKFECTIPNERDSEYILQHYTLEVLINTLLTKHLLNMH